MEILIYTAIISVYGMASYIWGFSVGKKVSRKNMLKSIGGLVANIVNKNNEDLKNCNAEKAYSLLVATEKTRESLRIYDKIINEFDETK